MSKNPDPNDLPPIEDLQQQLDALTADLQRTQADFINFRRRVEEERAGLSQAATARVVLQLLPLLDNIERALAHLPDELRGNPWAEGVAKLDRQFEAALKNLDVERIPAFGQPFDPQLHDALSYEEDGEGEEVVVAELEAGWRVGDHVIRHSKVKVGRRAPEQPGKANESPQPQDDPETQEQPED